MTPHDEQGPAREHEDTGALVARAQAGDSAAKEELCRRYEPLIAASARVYKGPHADWEDLMQAGYVEFLAAIRDFDVERGVYFGHFARLRVRGGVRTAIRRQERRLQAEQMPVEADGSLVAFADHSADQAASASEWSGLFSGLSPREKLAVQWIVLRGFSTTELAQKEGVSRETAKTWLRRAMQKLRARLGGDGA